MGLISAVRDRSEAVETLSADFAYVVSRASFKALSASREAADVKGAHVEVYLSHTGVSRTGFVLRHCRDKLLDPRNVRFLRQTSHRSAQQRRSEELGKVSD